MIDLDELNKQINNQSNRIKDIGVALNINDLEKELNELEKKKAGADFWNSEDSKEVLERKSSIKNKVNTFKSLKSTIDNEVDTIEFLKSDNDEELEKELEKEVSKTENELNSFEIQTLLSENMIEIMLLLQFTQELVEQKLWIGLKCYIECIQDGAKIIILN